MFDNASLMIKGKKEHGFAAKADGRCSDDRLAQAT